VNLDLILDLPVTVSIELGRTRLQVEDILRLGQGSVVELKKLAGEPLEILVQGRPIGKGEVVVMNEKYGIRLTDIISPVERIQRLA
jgi:flagellar motor switch protein FliN/FliY